MINCLVVDDEQHAIDVLVHYISQTPFLHLSGTTTNPLEGLTMVNTQPIDLIFLDIQMPEISGIDFIKAIRGKTRVILTTAYSEFALQGYEMEVTDYLLKPVSFPRFLQAAQRALSAQTNSLIKPSDNLQDDYIFVKTEVKGKMLKINLEDIDYIEGMKNYVAIHHGDTKTMALLNMKDLEDRLSKQHFVRVHKSFIVAVHKIVAIEGNMVHLKGVKPNILLGDTYKAGFMKIMKDKLLDR